MTSPRQHPRRRGLLRRPPAVHRPPIPPAPETPEEVLERAPTAGCGCPTLRPGESCPAHPFDPSQYVPPATDVSRETWAELEAAVELTGVEPARLPMGRYVAGGQVPPPPLRKDQVARLEALTAAWTREVRLEVPEDATMLHMAPRPPVPPARVASRAPEPVPLSPGPAPAQLEQAEVALAAHAAEAFRPGWEEQARASLDAAVAATPRRVSDWASRHDARSLEYAVRQRLRTPVPLQDVLLAHGPILDQGTTPPLSARDASACTGMAAVAAANVIEQALGSAGPHHGPNGGYLMEEDAHQVYELAQERDAISGHDYAGTSVLAVMKAGQELGWWDTYLWALGGTRDVAQVLLQLRVAVVVGIPWPAGMEEPDAAGIVRPAGPVGMGHCLAVIGIRRELPGQAPGPYFVLQQSRGTAEGDGGLVYLHHRDLATLLRGVGEAAVPLPRGVGEAAVPLPRGL